MPDSSRFEGSQNKDERPNRRYKIGQQVGICESPNPDKGGSYSLTGIILNYRWEATNKCWEYYVRLDTATVGSDGQPMIFEKEWFPEKGLIAVGLGSY